MSQEERTGWRDLAMSERHRRWGFNCPATDLDFMLLEYDQSKVAALIEYKNERAPRIEVKKSASVQALIDLGNRAEVPVFSVRYASDFSWWTVYRLNSYAAQIVPLRIEKCSEKSYVELLYRIRGREMPPSLFRNEPEVAQPAQDSFTTWLEDFLESL